MTTLRLARASKRSDWSGTSRGSGELWVIRSSSADRHTSAIVVTPRGKYTWTRHDTRLRLAAVLIVVAAQAQPLPARHALDGSYSSQDFTYYVVDQWLRQSGLRQAGFPTRARALEALESALLQLPPLGHVSVRTGTQRWIG